MDSVLLPKEEQTNTTSKPQKQPGESSPTSVADTTLSVYPSWWTTNSENNKNGNSNTSPPEWYAKGQDINALLDVADTLDWLADPGGGDDEDAMDMEDTMESNAAPPATLPSSSSLLLPRVDSSAVDLMTAVVDPTLPALFPSESTSHLLEHEEDPAATTAAPPHPAESSNAMAAATDELQVFDTPMEEQAFVSTILTSTGEEPPLDAPP